ncbi:HAMP domain-containing sensor histidine kinase [Virgibacillus halophilus]|uniref:histidine kinase n=1 Tax=Tigheibacillus halophilus TaxID=361280 RepID=A0ABU5C7T7_9BACI|nr:HAMP domain-containing sensor histidine kinase [Virgibacillus halophilus]
MLVVASLAIFVPILIAARFMSKFLLRPIQQLIHTMKENTESKNWKKIQMTNQSKDELYEMGQTFNEMIDNLEVNFEKQEIFVSDASHELKTPISIVKSYAQLLKRRGAENPAVFHEAIEAIDSEADRMQNLVEQMLQLAKSQVETNTETVELSKLVLDAYKTFSGAYKEREMYCDISEEAAALVVKGNQPQLQQIIYILIDNALKYTENAIEMKLSSEDGRASFKVKDHGEGISSADLEHIFDRFYRVDKARTRESGGTGLGLPIAKQIAQGHGGKLTVESVIGYGTTFTLQLPLEKEANQERH